MVLILPDLLEKDPHLFQQKLHQASIIVKRIHIDVIEPAFAPNPTILPEDWSLLDEHLEVDVHLMVEHPEEWIDRVIVAGGTLIIGHIEKLKTQQQFINTVLAKGVKAGLAIDLETPVEKLEIRNWKLEPAQILLMGVRAGYSGQPFDSRVLEKIQWLRQNCGENTEIAVDGGITLETAKTCLTAGANGIAVNTWLWQDFSANLHKLKQLG